MGRIADAQSEIADLTDEERSDYMAKALLLAWVMCMERKPGESLQSVTFVIGGPDDGMVDVRCSFLEV